MDGLLHYILRTIEFCPNCKQTVELKNEDQLKNISINKDMILFLIYCLAGKEQLTITFLGFEI